MRYFRTGLCLLILCVFLTACSPTPASKEPKGDVVLRPVKLNEFEENILGFTTDWSFVFDLQRNKDIGEIAITVELYKRGQSTGPILEGGILDDKKSEKPLRIAMARQTIEEGRQKWLLGYFNDGVRSELSGIEDIPKGDNTIAGASTQTELPLAINKGEKKTIAAFVSTKDNGIATRDLEDLLKNPKTTSKFDRVYLVQAELK